MNRSLLFFVLLMMVATTTGCKPEEATTDVVAAKPAPVEPTQPIPNQVAKVGVGVKGSSVDGLSDSNPSKLIAGPVSALFRAKEKIAFDIQIVSAMNTFRAIHDRYPKSQEEYMREIIEPGRVKLPKLPEGMIYRYHPESHELWVEGENNPQGSTAPADDN